jgi:PhoPQ-activated pathogenicity-related protein
MQPARPLLLLLALAVTASADLASYLARPEPAAQWTLKSTSEYGGCEVTQYELISQVWEGIEWKHDLLVFRPQAAPPSEVVFLLNNGGRAKPEGLPYGALIANKTQCPVAFLLGVPNQPLFDGKKEDDLIAETFVRYLETENPNWPLLFPMVKSVTKAMDAIQAVSAAWPKKAQRFIVSGASKRGWTSWLTAAGDPRVMAIAPMVIDVLNMPAQMVRQVECFGRPSEQIDPYVKRNLVPMPDTPAGRRLWQWVDPWTYREKFTMPKLIVLGTNDRYWAPDALNLYWDALPGEKWISYSPNAGHDLTEKRAEGGKDPWRAVNATAAFVRHLVTGRPLPRLGWKHDDTEGRLRLTVTAEPMPKEIRLWRANGPSKDLREATWEPRAVSLTEGRGEFTESRPASGASAFFAELEYAIDDLTYSLCTQLRLVEATDGTGQ